MPWALFRTFQIPFRTNPAGAAALSGPERPKFRHDPDSFVLVSFVGTSNVCRTLPLNRKKRLPKVVL
jgi:hypothetical protein